MAHWTVLSQRQAASRLLRFPSIINFSICLLWLFWVISYYFPTNFDEHGNPTKTLPPNHFRTLLSLFLFVKITRFGQNDLFLWFVPLLPRKSGIFLRRCCCDSVDWNLIKSDFVFFPFIELNYDYSIFFCYCCFWSNFQWEYFNECASCGWWRPCVAPCTWWICFWVSSGCAKGFWLI